MVSYTCASPVRSRSLRGSRYVDRTLSASAANRSERESSLSFQPCSQLSTADGGTSEQPTRKQQKITLHPQFKVPPHSSTSIAVQDYDKLKRKQWDENGRQSLFGNVRWLIPSQRPKRMRIEGYGEVFCQEVKMITDPSVVEDEQGGASTGGYEEILVADRGRFEQGSVDHNSDTDHETHPCTISSPRQDKGSVAATETAGERASAEVLPKLTISSPTKTIFISKTADTIIPSAIAVPSQSNMDSLVLILNDMPYTYIAFPTLPAQKVSVSMVEYSILDAAFSKMGESL